MRAAFIMALATLSGCVSLDYAQQMEARGEAAADIADALAIRQLCKLGTRGAYQRHPADVQVAIADMCHATTRIWSAPSWDEPDGQP